MHHIYRYTTAILSPLAIAAIVCAVFWLTSSRPLPVVLLEGRHLISVDPSSKVTVRAHEGETVTASFTVKNITDEPLRLLGANTSCGCTVVTTEFPMELKPGGSANLVVSMKVQKPGPDGKAVNEANLLVNRAGVVPAMIIEALVSSS